MSPERALEWGAPLSWAGGAQQRPLLAVSPRHLKTDNDGFENSLVLPESHVFLLPLPVGGKQSNFAFVLWQEFPSDVWTLWDCFRFPKVPTQCRLPSSWSVVLWAVRVTERNVLLMNTIHPSIPQRRGEKLAALRVTTSQPGILSMWGITYWFFPISPMCVDFSIKSIHTASSLEAVGYAANSPPCPSDPYSSGSRVFPSFLPPPGQILSREGEKKIRINICKNWALNIPWRLTYLQ